MGHPVSVSAIYQDRNPVIAAGGEILHVSRDDGIVSPSVLPQTQLLSLRFQLPGANLDAEDVVVVLPATAGSCDSPAARTAAGIPTTTSSVLSTALLELTIDPAPTHKLHSRNRVCIQFRGSGAFFEVAPGSGGVLLGGLLSVSVSAFSFLFLCSESIRFLNARDQRERNPSEPPSDHHAHPRTPKP